LRQRTGEAAGDCAPRAGGECALFLAVFDFLIRVDYRGGWKLIMRPDGAVPTPKLRRDEMMLRALVRAHRWRLRIEQARSTTDLAERRVTDAYVCGLLPLTCLEPPQPALTKGFAKCGKA
jgi:hypothetical protein